MSNNVCCVTWNELYPELKEAKQEELQVHLDKGLPRSMFAALYKTLEGMGNYCPCCGASTNDAAPIVRPLTTETAKAALPPVAKTVKRPCPSCHGRGTARKNMVKGDPDSLLCMTCHGEGTYDRKQDSCRDEGGMEAVTGEVVIASDD